jgi:hypothetical protein
VELANGADEAVIVLRKALGEDPQYIDRRDHLRRSRKDAGNLHAEY